MPGLAVQCKLGSIWSGIYRRRRIRVVGPLWAWAETLRPMLRPMRPSTRSLPRNVGGCRPWNGFFFGGGGGWVGGVGVVVGLDLKGMLLGAELYRNWSC